MVRNKTARRRRYIGAASAVVVAGVVTMGFLGGGTAIAEGSDHEIVFNGKCGVLGLGSKSEPSPASSTVTEGDKVTFTNNLGTDGVLYIGSAKSDVDEGESKTVTLTNGTEAKMAPKCTLGESGSADKATVKVEPKQDAPNGGGSGDGDGSNGGGSGDDGDSNGGGSNDDGDSTADGADKPDGSPDTGKKPKAEGNAGDPNKDKDGDGKADDEAAGSGGSDGASTDEKVDKVDTATKSSTGNSASALLAALAALCLAGVGFAALRTYISSRGAANA